jgi:hypothetical protein
MVKLVNNNCAELKALMDGPRLEGRVRLSIVVLVIPVVKSKPQLSQTFAAVTKEFSSTGVALVVNEPKPVEQAIVAFRWDSGMKFIRGEAKHLNPMGAGFYQLGLRLTEVVHPSDQRELETVTF